MLKQENYYVTFGWMVTELKLSGITRDVYAIIYGFSQTEKQRYDGSISYLAEWAFCSKRTIMNSLNKLISLGYITKMEYYKKNVKYCMYSCVPLEEIRRKREIAEKENAEKENVKKESGEKISLPDKNPSGGEKNSCPAVKNFPSGGEKFSPNINININRDINSPAGQRPDKNSVKKPSREEVENYCKRCKHRISVDDFYRYYDKHGWWKDWKRAVRKWEDSCPDRICPSKNEFNKFKQNDYDFDELEKLIVDN